MPSMDPRMDPLLQCLQPLLDSPTYSLLQTTINIQHPSANPYESVRDALTTLRSSDRISADLAQRLALATQIAQASGNNAALVKAMDSDRNVNNLRDHATIVEKAPAPPPQPQPQDTAPPAAVDQGDAVDDQSNVSGADPDSGGDTASAPADVGAAPSA